MANNRLTKFQYSRIQNKISSLSGQTPTIYSGSTTAVTETDSMVLGNFQTTDILDGEFYLNTADNKLFIRSDDEIVKINSTCSDSGLIFVDDINDLPSTTGDTITLLSGVTYFFTSNIDLNGKRLVGSYNTVITGGSSENAMITSTGLGVGIPLFQTEWTTTIRFVSFSDIDTAINISGTTNAPVAINLTGVNFVNVPNIGTVDTSDNFIYNKGAFINSKGLKFTGTHGTIAFSESIFRGDNLGGNIFELDADCIITRRFRIIYSSIVVPTSDIGINVSTGATIPTESYILDTINFSGLGTYTSGIDYLSNEVRWTQNKGVINTSENANYFMTNNAVVTTITSSSTPVKVEGSTTANTINQKFDHTDNRVTYTGEIIRDFQVTATVSFETGNNKEIGLYVAKNGSLIPSSEMFATSSGSGRGQSITVQTITQLIENDYIEIWVENISDTTDVTVTFLNVIVKSIN